MEPASDAKKKRKVYVKVNFLKLLDINTIKEEFVADVFIQIRWREPALDSAKDDTTDFSKYWDPKIQISNGGPNLAIKSWKRLKRGQNGEAFVVEKMRVKGSLSENMELHEFPFDIQDLSVSVSTELSVDEIEILEDDHEVSSINVQCFEISDETEWFIRDFVYSEPRILSKEFTEGGIRNPALFVRSVATRRPGFFVYNIILIMTMITTLSFTTFGVNRALTQNRLQLMFIITLTGVTFKTMTNQSLPKIPYLTHLDKLIIASMVFTWLVCVWHGIISLFTYDLNMQATMDFWAFIGFIILYAIFQTIFFTLVIGKRIIREYEIREKKRIYMEKATSLMGVSWKEDRLNRKRGGGHLRSQISAMP